MDSMLDKFYKTFEIKKVKYYSPAREVDEDGNISAYYEELQYPYICGDIFFDLLDLAEYFDVDLFEGIKKPEKCSRFYLTEMLISDLLDGYESMDTEKAADFKEEIQELFEGYYTLEDEDDD